MKNELLTYSLSLEELSLCLSMINRPDLGQEVLKSFYDKLSKVEVDSRMVAASHSILARGICGLTKDGTPRLDSELEQALLPLANYDYAIQFSLVQADNPLHVTIHIRKAGTFTAHNIQAGVIHLLEHGSIKQLPAYVLDLLEGYGADKRTALASVVTINLGVLGTALSVRSDKQDVLKILDNEKINKADLELLSEDLINQTSRASLIRLNGNSETPMEKIKQTPMPTQLILKGKSRTWLFDFASSDNEAVTKALLVTREELLVKIKTLVN